MDEAEISGSGYARSAPDKCPDHIPLHISDPDAVTFDASEIKLTLVPRTVENTTGVLWASPDGWPTIWDIT